MIEPGTSTVFPHKKKSEKIVAFKLLILQTRTPTCTKERFFARAYTTLQVFSCISINDRALAYHELVFNVLSNLY